MAHSFQCTLILTTTPFIIVTRVYLWPPCVANADIIFMAALRNRAGHYIFALWVLSFFIFVLA